MDSFDGLDYWVSGGQDYYFDMNYREPRIDIRPRFMKLHREERCKAADAYWTHAASLDVIDESFDKLKHFVVRITVRMAKQGSLTLYPGDVANAIAKHPPVRTDWGRNHRAVYDEYRNIFNTDETFRSEKRFFANFVSQNAMPYNIRLYHSVAGMLHIYYQRVLTDLSLERECTARKQLHDTVLSALTPPLLPPLVQIIVRLSQLVIRPPA